MSKHKNKNNFKNNFNNNPYKKVLFKDAIANLKRDFKEAINEMSDAEFIELFSFYLSCIDNPFNPEFMEDYEDDYENFTIDEELPF